MLRLPFIFRGKLSGTAYVGRGGGGVVEGKRREDEQEKGGLSDGGVNKGWE